MWQSLCHCGWNLNLLQTKNYMLIDFSFFCFLEIPCSIAIALFWNLRYMLGFFFFCFLHIPCNITIALFCNLLYMLIDFFLLLFTYTEQYCHRIILQSSSYVNWFFFFCFLQIPCSIANALFCKLFYMLIDFFFFFAFYKYFAVSPSHYFAIFFIC